MTRTSKPNDAATASDDELLARARGGDRRAYGELWRRHSGAGKSIARRFTAPDQADDLVAEAFTRILSTMQRGGGPVSGFRPYLITTIRNVASRWAEKQSAIQVDDFDQFEDPSTLVDPAIAALDRTLTLTAFRSLPERWQTVLWYSEVEGMDPHEIAPFLGITPNATAALCYRARAGLRTAWLQAHLNDDSSSPECRWTTARLSGYVADKLTGRERLAVARHLENCTKCTIIAGELDHIGARLAFALIPLVAGTTVGASLIAAAHGTTVAATPAPVIHLASLTTVASPATMPTGWIVAAALTIGVIGAGGTVVALSSQPHHPTTTASALHGAPTPRAATSPAPTPRPAPTAIETPPTETPPPPTQAPPAASTRAVPAPASPIVTPPPTVDTVAPAAPVVLSAVDDTALAPFAISGTGEPNATVSIFDDHSALLGTAIVSSAGTWTSPTLSGLLPTAGSLTVTQKDAAGNVSPAATVGPIALVPTVASPADGAEFESGDSIPIVLQGWTGASIQASIDGAVVLVGTETTGTIGADGTLPLTAIGLSPGAHTLGFRYVSADGSSAGQATVQVTIAP